MTSCCGSLWLYKSLIILINLRVLFFFHMEKHMEKHMDTGKKHGKNLRKIKESYKMNPAHLSLLGLCTCVVVTVSAELHALPVFRCFSLVGTFLGGEWMFPLSPKVSLVCPLWSLLQELWWTEKWGFSKIRPNCRSGGRWLWRKYWWRDRKRAVNLSLHISSPG